MSNLSKLAVVLVISLIVGYFIGNGVSSAEKDKQIRDLIQKQQKELQKEIEQSLEAIQRRDNKIKELESLGKKDSLLIVDLKFQIKQDGVKTEQKRQDAAKYTNKEQVEFLVNRYRTANQ